MKIFLKSIANLRNYFGYEPVELELPENSTLQTVVDIIAERWGSQLPTYMWDSSKLQFRGPILLLVDKKVQTNFSEPLKNGQEVTILKALMGG